MIHVLLVIFVFIYLYWCPTWFPYYIMFVSFSSNTTGVNSGTGTVCTSEAHEFILWSWWGSWCSI